MTLPLVLPRLQVSHSYLVLKRHLDYVNFLGNWKVFHSTTFRHPIWDGMNHLPNVSPLTAGTMYLIC